MPLERRPEAAGQGLGGRVDEHDAVRVAHRHRRDPQPLARHLERPRPAPRGADPRPESRRCRSWRCPSPRTPSGRPRGPGSGPRRPGGHREGLVADPTPVPEVAREDPQAVAALLGLRAVGVEDAHGEAAIRRRALDQDAVGADAQMPVAERARHGAGDLGPVRLQHEVVVAEGLVLVEAHRLGSYAAVAHIAAGTPRVERSGRRLPPAPVVVLASNGDGSVPQLSTTVIAVPVTARSAVPVVPSTPMACTGST